MEGAIRFQLDSLHPYGDEEICWGWSPLAYGACWWGWCGGRRSDRYVQLFTEAGIAVSSFTFSAAAVHSAIRLNGAAAAAHAGGFVALSRSVAGARGGIWGKRRAPGFLRRILSAARTRGGAGALRVAPAARNRPVPLEQVLPAPAVNPVEHDLSRNALPYAAALAGACPGWRRRRTCCPPSTASSIRARSSSRRWRWGVLLVATAAAMAISEQVGERRYLDRLNAEISRLEPQAQRAPPRRARNRPRSRAPRLLDRFRNQTRNDLDRLERADQLV